MKQLFLFIQVMFFLIWMDSSAYAFNKIKLVYKATLISLNINQTRYTFTKKNGQWAFFCAYVKGEPVARPISPKDAFLLNSGEAFSVNILKNTSKEIEICFTGFKNRSAGSIS